jgi:O-methyltransferase domain
MLKKAGKRKADLRVRGRKKEKRKPAAARGLKVKKGRKKVPARRAKKTAASAGGALREMPPQAGLMQALFGMMVTKSVSAVAALGVADALQDGPLYYTDLAEAVGADQRSLHRVMRMLSSTGIFAEHKPGTYGLTPVSNLLRADVPDSLRDLAVVITAHSHWTPWGRLDDVLRTGVSGPRHVFGEDIFTWFQREENREEWQVFNAAMTSFSMGVARAVAAAVDFSGFSRFVDIGGGHGYLLKTLLAQAPRAKGKVYDLPGVVAGAEPLKGIEFVGGDFFASVPSGGDCYLLKHIIHDWSDDQSVAILTNIAAAMDADGRVFVIEIVMPESPEAHPAKFMDVNMLAMTEGGCERTEREYAGLFRKAGLKLLKVHPTESPVSAVEAAKA